jgi:hypothetical protein
MAAADAIAASVRVGANPAPSISGPARPATAAATAVPRFARPIRRPASCAGARSVVAAQFAVTNAPVPTDIRIPPTTSPARPRAGTSATTPKAPTAAPDAINARRETRSLMRPKARAAAPVASVSRARSPAVSSAARSAGIPSRWATSISRNRPVT